MERCGLCSSRVDMGKNLSIGIAVKLTLDRMNVSVYMVWEVYIYQMLTLALNFMLFDSAAGLMLINIYISYYYICDI